MNSIAYAPGATARSSPARVTHLEEERARLHAAEEREARGFIQVPRALRPRCKKLSAGEWAVLVEVLDRGVSWGRFEPQKITLADFRASSGFTKQAIADGISGLVERGVLYAERTGASRKSAVRYAIIDPAALESGPSPTAEGTLVIYLLGGLAYPVNPVFLKNRNTPSIPTKQENVFLKSRNPNPTKQEKESLESRKTNSAEAAPGQAPEVPQERT